MKRAYFIKDLITPREYEIIKGAVGRWEDYTITEEGKGHHDPGKDRLGHIHFQLSPITKIDETLGRLIASRYGIEFAHQLFIGSKPDTIVDPHKDSGFRSSILTFPLMPNLTKTFYGYNDKQGKEVVHEFNYSTPCILNTSEFHGGKYEGDVTQIVYQISTSQSWDTVIKILRERNLIEEEV